MKLHLFLVGISMFLMLATPLSATPIAFEKEAPGYSSTDLSPSSTGSKQLKKGSFFQRLLLKRALKKAKKKSRPDTEKKEISLGKLSFFISIGSIPFSLVPLIGLLAPLVALAGCVMGAIAMDRQDGYGWGLAAFMVGMLFGVFMLMAIFGVL